jgi:hypothetical protein
VTFPLLVPFGGLDLFETVDSFLIRGLVVEQWKFASHESGMWDLWAFYGTHVLFLCEF